MDLQILKKAETLEKSSSKQYEFYKDIKKAYFKILPGFNFGLALRQADICLLFRNVR